MRRRFLATTSLDGVAGLLGTVPALSVDAQLETTTVRLGRSPGICAASQAVAEELLRIRCGFMLYACAKPGSSRRARRRSSPTAPIGLVPWVTRLAATTALFFISGFPSSSP